MDWGLISVIRYVNSQGKEADLSQFPVRLREAIFHAYEWSYEGASQRYGVDIDYFKKDPIEYEMVVSFFGTNDQKKHLLNDFCDLVEYDVQNTQPGRLYIEDYYVDCFIVSSSTEPSEYSRVDRAMKVLCPYPFWVRETAYQFLPNTQTTQPGTNTPVITGGIYTGPKTENGAMISEFSFDFVRENDQKVEYPLFDLPFDFIGIFGVQQVNNPASMPCNFQMVIYGYVESPSVIIGDHTYMVQATVFDGERLVIDSRYKTVEKIGRFGEITNLYNARNKVQSVFEPILPGDNVISWSGAYGVDLTLYDERSEPRWISQSAAQT